MASAATILASFNPTLYVSGTATINEMTGYWTNRVASMRSITTRSAGKRSFMTVEMGQRRYAAI